MKSFFLIALLIIAGLSAAAQLEKQVEKKFDSQTYGEVKHMGVYIASIERVTKDSDTLYLLQFRNSQYTYNVDIQQIRFTVEDGLLDTLYNMLSAAIDSPKDSKISFKLGTEELEVTTLKVIGLKGINITMLRNRAYFGLNRKQLDRLFNRKAN
ncbi:MAG: hypothetical protein ACTHMC_23755 [Pseudobacter sp.]|uniref:hypothetical protein n=1 Tax=Pseudobacter sp. TaxID=2045420 RepID=UPI003F809A67